MNKTRILVIVLITAFISVLTTLVIISVVDSHRKQNSPPENISEYTIFTTKLDDRYRKAIENDDYQNFDSGVASMSLAPKIACFSNEKTCLVDSINNKLIIYANDGNQQEEFNINLPEDKLWIDSVVSIDTNNASFILRALYEKEYDEFEAKYYLFELSNPELKPVMFGEKESVFAKLNEPLAYYKNRVIIGEGSFEGAFKFDRDEMRLLLDEEFNLKKVEFKNRKTLYDEENFLEPVDSIYSSDYEYEIFLEFCKDDDFWYIQAYPTKKVSN